MRSSNGSSENNLRLKILNLIEYLKDVDLVVKFQRYFGVLRFENHSQKHLIYDKNNFTDKIDVKLRENNHINDNVGHWLNGYDNNESTKLSSNYGHKRDLSQCSVTTTDTDYCDSSTETDTKFSNEKDNDYVITNKFWYYLFSFGASLGYELFYASFFPIWFWNIDGAVGRRMVLIWTIIMYIGQALKDVIQWPRPSSPPVVVLEPDYAIEYGMPSTHAMVSAALPVSMIIFTMNRYDYPVFIGVIVAIIWCVLVCGSRLYLGMHSVLDIVAGLLLTALLMIIIIPLVDAIDQFHLTNPYSPLFTIPLIVLMAIFYPKSKRWSPARGDTCVITGAGAGILIGSWLNYQLGIIRGPGLPPPFPIIWPGYGVIGLSLLRASIGILCIVAARAIGKVFVFSLLCYIRNLDPKDPKTKIRVSVEIPCKVITYMSMGFTITYLSPVVFRLLNIERVTMFTEV